MVSFWTTMEKTLSVPPCQCCVRNSRLNLRLGHKSPPLSQPWHSVPRWCLPCCGPCPKGGIGISARPIHHRQTRPLIPGAEAPVGSTCPCVFTLVAQTTPTPQVHLIPHSFSERLEVIGGCETTLHVQRHSFKVTFTLRSAVKIY